MSPMLRLRAVALRLALLAGLVATLSAGAAGAATQVHFKTPSGNINCYLFSAQGGVADCIVLQASWTNAPPKPKACDLDWVPTELALGKTYVSVGGCRGDVGPRCYTGGGNCSVLAYGHSITMGTIRCSSATSGLTCRRTTGRHAGFRLARESFPVYR
jgi:hypothetical protein